MTEPRPMRRLPRWLEDGLFAARWLMAPVYLGMAVMLALLAVKFAQELVHVVPLVLSMVDTELIAAALTLVDLTLVANLLAMVTLVGYQNFVTRIHRDTAQGRPDWLDQTDFSGLKMKLIGSIISIAGIDLLKRFLEVHDTPASEMVIQTGVFLAFVVAGLLLALMDRLTGHGPEDH